MNRRKQKNVTIHENYKSQKIKIKNDRVYYTENVW